MLWCAKDVYEVISWGEGKSELFVQHLKCSDLLRANYNNNWLAMSKGPSRA